MNLICSWHVSFRILKNTWFFPIFGMILKNTYLMYQKWPNFDENIFLSHFWNVPLRILKNVTFPETWHNFGITQTIPHWMKTHFLISFFAQVNFWSNFCCQILCLKLVHISRFVEIPKNAFICHFLNFKVKQNFTKIQVEAFYRFSAASPALNFEPNLKCNSSFCSQFYPLSF